jgi:myo-inositol 2-dehydrogenase/D-chiro-inositol 1-dehydrogenase
MTIHDLDMARFFLGEIVEVSATGTQIFDDGAREHGDFDTVAVTLLAASGSIATITNSRHFAIGYDQRLEAHGGKGMVQVSNASTSLVRISTAKAVDATGAFVDLFTECYVVAYVRELNEFLRLVREGYSTSPTFDDGRAALLIADAAQRSATEYVAVRLDANERMN